MRVASTLVLMSYVILTSYAKNVWLELNSKRQTELQCASAVCLPWF